MHTICDQILTNGTCYVEGCTARHDVHTCQPCRTVFTHFKELEEHLKGGEHHRRFQQREKRLAGLSLPVQCTICQTSLTSVKEYKAHARGRRHRTALKKKNLEEDPGPEELDVRPGVMRCDTCDTDIPPTHWDVHLRSQRHLRAGGYVVLKNALEQSESDKNGVTVSGSASTIDIGIIDVSSRSIESVHSLSLENTNPTDIILHEARISSVRSASAGSQFSIRGFQDVMKIAPGSTNFVSVVFVSSNQRGLFENRVELIFEDPTVKQRFAITRPIQATVGVKEDYEALRATAPYVRPKRQPEELMKDIIHGIPPPALAAIKWTVKLPIYPGPKALLDVAYGMGNPKDIAIRVRSTFLPATFDGDTYGRSFHNLLWIEEERAKRDLQLYNMEGVTLIPNHHFYRLEVKGLAEKRPSIIVTDRIFVRNYGSVKDHWFEGHVHRVYEKAVDLRFSDRFKSFQGQKYDVRFDLNRLTYRRMHQALDIAFNAKRVLFPAPEHIRELRPPTYAQRDGLIPGLINRKIAENPPQQEAIAAIVNRPPGSVPFVVFGPPGTGKTVTVVEAIRQILVVNRDAHILACAPSNSAADLIAERLSGLGKTLVFRLNAASRNKKQIPPTILNLSLVNSDDVFCVPPVADLQKYNVVVSTCMSASIPYGIGIRRGHFNYIFIDEAGQACEPEVMIGIKTMADNNTNIILSGDSKQLGPIVRSPIARELGLAVSYLDRLTGLPIYDEDSGKGKTLVKLTKNWRSHPSILQFPNDEFYRGELQACGDPAITHSLLRWDGLVSPNMPIIFHGIAGKDEREASSPSFFNIDEASLVKYYVKELFGDKKLRLTAEHIGIISPYNAQVGKIRSIVSNIVKGIKVGSVEEFQGQERRVVIISTVRSSTDFINFDLRHTLGFVANPRRFNVAITRAQALLIVIGDPTVLSLDPLWRGFINYVHVQGGYKGKPIDWDPRVEIDRTVKYDGERRRKSMQEREEMMDRLKAEIMAQSEDLGDREDNDEDALEGNVDRPWREDE